MRTTPKIRVVPAMPGSVNTSAISPVVVDLREARRHDVRHAAHRSEKTQTDFFGGESRKSVVQRRLVFGQNRPQQ